MLDTEYKKVNSKSIVMSSNYLKDNKDNTLLKLLQKLEEMFDGTSGKHTGLNYNLEPKEHTKSYALLL